jgi:hypothetical protein
LKPLAFRLLPLLVTLGVAQAHAAGVVIVQPAGSAPELTETLFRLHGELSSVGLGVEIVERPTLRELDATGSRGWLERTAAARGADAILDISGDVAPSAIDIWIFPRAPRPPEVFRVTREPNADNATERLAIRAIEVLRSSLLEADLVGRPKPSASAAREPPGALAQTAVETPAVVADRIGLAVGAAVLASTDGVGPAIVPLVRVDWPVHPRLVLQAAAAGFGSRPSVATTAGSARVSQQYGVIGVCYADPAARGVRPFFALAAGALRTTADGQAELPAQAHFAAQWSLLLEASLGARWRLPGRTYVTLAAHVHFAQPYVAIHLLDAVAATTGRPNLLLSLTVGAWL